MNKINVERPNVVRFFISVIILVSWPYAVNAAEELAPFASFYTDAKPFEDALNREAHSATPARITGLIVPHHILASDLIARAFWAASNNVYDRIVILCPDHFNKSKKPLATTARDIDTVFGIVANDKAATAVLLNDTSLFDDSDLFTNEHGVAVLLPFIKRLFPAAKIAPIAISYGSTREDWDRALTEIQPLIGPHTLLVQSTDFSHYLSVGIAMQRDQESLNVIAAGDVEAVVGLLQPDHLDSKAALYLQMRIQSGLKSSPTVIANRNAIEYEPSAEKTTSYVVAAYSTDPHPEYSYADQNVILFGGDFFASRGLTEPLANGAVSRKLLSDVLAITRSTPLILNLEGAIVDEIPPNVPVDLHAMDKTLAVPFLQQLHVNAVSLANNHSFDLGSIGLKSSYTILGEAGIRPLPQGRIEDLGFLRLTTLNFVVGRNRDGYPLAGHQDLDALCHSHARPPVIAFVHWGLEYRKEASRAEFETAAALHDCGVSAIIGAHSHQASHDLLALNGGEYLMLFSLGNFLFDQSSPRGSGALLELRFFHQGTFAARLVPIPNFFDEVRFH